MIDPTIQPDSFPRVPRAALMMLWLIALVALFAGLGTPPVDRTQEARVVETAREMLGQPFWPDWMNPQFNGELRLRKPPLAYWMAAGAFSLLGVSEFAGRLPFILCAWLHLPIVWDLGRRWLGERAALFAAVAMGSSYMFLRYGRVAETDAPSAMLISLAIWGFVAAADSSGLRRFLLYQVTGMALGLALLVKGPPVAFAAIFFVGWIVIERDWRSARGLICSGALVTMALIAAPWFIHLYRIDARRVATELSVTLGGEDHPGSALSYVPQLFIMMTPWSPLALLGLAQVVYGSGIIAWAGRVIARGRRPKPTDGAAGACPVSATPQGSAKESGPKSPVEGGGATSDGGCAGDELGPDELRELQLSAGGERAPVERVWPEARGARATLLWGAAVLLPLCLIGNKQFHYLVSLIPPMALCAGFTLSQAVRAQRWKGAQPRPRRFVGEPADPRVAAPVLTLTLILLALAGPALLWVARSGRGFLMSADIGIAIFWTFATLTAVAIHRANGLAAGIVAGGIASAAAWSIYFGTFAPSLVVSDHRTVARQIRARTENAPICFYGQISYPLAYHLRAVAPLCRDEAALKMALGKNPELIVIALSKNNRAAPPAPAELERRMKSELGDDGAMVEVYQKARRP